MNNGRSNKRGFLLGGGLMLVLAVGFFALESRLDALEQEWAAAAPRLQEELKGLQSSLLEKQTREEQDRGRVVLMLKHLGEIDAGTEAAEDCRPDVLAPVFPPPVLAPEGPGGS